MPRIAEIDRAILAQLRKNGRMSYVDLASKVGASERTVRTHIRSMEENGTIRGYTIREGGVGLTALVRIKVAPGSEIGSFCCRGHRMGRCRDRVRSLGRDRPCRPRSRRRHDGASGLVGPNVARCAQRYREHHHRVGPRAVLRLFFLALWRGVVNAA